MKISLYVRDHVKTISWKCRMLYISHSVIGDSFSWKRPNHDQTLIEKPLCSDLYFLWEKKNKLLFNFSNVSIWHTPLLLHLVSYLIFFKAFFSQVVTLESLFFLWEVIFAEFSITREIRFLWKLPRTLYIAGTWL